MALVTLELLPPIMHCFVPLQVVSHDETFLAFGAVEGVLFRMNAQVVDLQVIGIPENFLARFAPMNVASRETEARAMSFLLSAFFR